MTDEQYVFMEDVRNRKNLASQAKYRKNGSKSKTCKMAYEYLTKKEQMALNGKCVSYKLGEPMSWEDFKALPADKKELYFDFLNNLGARPCDVMKMFDITGPVFSNYIYRCNLPKLQARGRIPNEKFVSWYDGFTTKKAENESEKIPQEEISETKPKNDLFTKGEFELHGTAKDISELLNILMTEDETYTIRLCISKEEPSGL